MVPYPSCGITHCVVCIISVTAFGRWVLNVCMGMKSAVGLNSLNEDTNIIMFCLQSDNNYIKTYIPITLVNKILQNMISLDILQPRCMVVPLKF